MPTRRVAVVIPCFRVSGHIESVVASIPGSVDSIYCVNDGCPDNSTRRIEEAYAHDGRVRVIIRRENGGVGAAVVDGYRAALETGADIVIKLDGDGQMDPALIPVFVEEIAQGRADYVKGNRFYSLEQAKAMPLGRKIGNIGLSFMNKLSTGYWQLFDPTNGYTAIHANVLKVLPLDKIEPRFFFESDMLFHLGLLRARIVEVPTDALYANEKSNLSVPGALVSFPLKHGRNFCKRIFYDYFLRNFNFASLELLVGVAATFFGVIFGVDAWLTTARTGEPATAGTVMLASLPTIIGLQLILNFFAYDMAREPTQAIFERLRMYRPPKDSG